MNGILTAIALIAAQGQQSIPTVPSTEATISTPAIRASDGRARSPSPLGNPGSWATASDYPSAALREEKEGVSRFTLEIDADGTPTKCTITESSGNEALDSQTCSLILARARFEPAVDAKGKRVSGAWSSSVRWEIPGVSIRGIPIPTDIEIVMVVGTDGSVESCSVSKRTGMPEGAELCQSSIGRRFQPPVDETGKAIRKRVIMRSTVTVENVTD